MESGTDLDLHVTTGAGYDTVSLLGAGHGSVEAIRGPHQLLVTTTFVGQLEHLLQWPVAWETETRQFPLVMQEVSLTGLLCAVNCDYTQSNKELTELAWISLTLSGLCMGFLVPIHNLLDPNTETRIAFNNCYGWVFWFYFWWCFHENSQVRKCERNLVQNHSTQPTKAKHCSIHALRHGMAQEKFVTWTTHYNRTIWTEITALNSWLIMAACCEMLMSLTITHHAITSLISTLTRPSNIMVYSTIR